MVQVKQIHGSIKIPCDKIKKGKGDFWAVMLADIQKQDWSPPDFIKEHYGVNKED